MVDVDDVVTGAQLAQVLEEALLLPARLALDAALTNARAKDLFLSDVRDAFAPQDESIAELAQTDVVQDPRRDPVAPEEVDQTIRLMLCPADQ